MNIAAYREAERRLYDRVGLQPTERVVELPRLGSRVRVLEAGEGEAALFIHGGPNAGGTWAALAAAVSGLRCLILDRPGTGLSEPPREPVGAANVKAFGQTLAVDVLDGLEIDRAHLVASSFGGMIALRSAGAYPDRFDRMVQMAAPALLPMSPLPSFMKAFLIPGLRQLIVALPPSRSAGLRVLRQLGHGASIDRGLIADAFLDWYEDLQRYTDTFTNDTAMISRLGSFFTGVAPEALLTDEELATVTTPTHFIWGAEDCFGGEEVARHVIGQMPNAQLELWQDSGHLPWLDDVERAAKVVQSFLVG